MPTGALEARIAALFTLIDGALAVEVLRNRATPVDIPAAGLAILFDGAPGDPAITMPLRYHYDHAAELYLYAQVADGASPSRAAILDGLRGAVGTAIAANRTLGGLCDWVEADLVETDVQPVEGAAPIRFDLIRVTLSYVTDNPLT